MVRRCRGPMSAICHISLGADGCEFRREDFTHFAGVEHDVTNALAVVLGSARAASVVQESRAPRRGRPSCGPPCRALRGGAAFLAESTPHGVIARSVPGAP